MRATSNWALCAGNKVFLKHSPCGLPASLITQLLLPKFANLDLKLFITSRIELEADSYVIMTWNWARKPRKRGRKSLFDVTENNLYFCGGISCYLWRHFGGDRGSAEGMRSMIMTCRVVWGCAGTARAMLTSGKGKSLIAIIANIMRRIHIFTNILLGYKIHKKNWVTNNICFKHRRRHFTRAKGRFHYNIVWPD